MRHHHRRRLLPATSSVSATLLAMDMNPYPNRIDHFPFLGGDYVRVYSFNLLHPVDRLLNHSDVIAHSLRHYRPLPHPFTWCVYGDYAAIVNITDLYDYQIRQRSSSSLPSTTTTTNPQLHQRYRIPADSVSTVDEVMMLQEVGGHHHAHAMDQTSGLTKKLISKKLQVTTYPEGEEKDEMCVVCQSEFGKNDRVVVLRCKHRYHPTCIEEWLLLKNVCPLCKTQALKV